MSPGGFAIIDGDGQIRQRRQIKRDGIRPDILAGGNGDGFRAAKLSALSVAGSIVLEVMALGFNAMWTEFISTALVPKMFEKRTRNCFPPMLE